MMPFANILLDGTGCVWQWNPRAQRLFGFAKDAVVGQPMSRLYEGLDPAAAGLLLRAATEVGYADHEGSCVRQNGSRFPAQTLITALRRDGELIGFSLVVQNLTERSPAQQHRRDEESRLNSVIQSAMDAIITVDDQQNIVLFNGAAEKIFRCSAADAIGRPLDQFIPARFREAHRRHIAHFGATGITMRRMGDQTVLYGLRTGGEEFPIEASISQVTAGGNRLFTVILRDITSRLKATEELEKSHRQLLELYAAMNEVREAERMRIARELHDELAQWLTALKMDITWIAGRLPRDQEPLAHKAEKVKGLIDATVSAVRRIAADLRPMMLDDLGLVPAIENLLHEFSERTGIVISFDAEAEAQFRDPLTTAVYRMLQEALTNVARHAEASQVQVTMKIDNGSLLVQARDNGKGIGSAPPGKERSFGILGIKERAHTLGGRAEVFSPPEGGTVVEVVIPVERYRRAETGA